MSKLSLSILIKIVVRGIALLEDTSDSFIERELGQKVKGDKSGCVSEWKKPNPNIYPPSDDEAEILMALFEERFFSKVTLEKARKLLNIQQNTSVIFSEIDEQESNPFQNSSKLIDLNGLLAILKKCVTKRTCMIRIGDFSFNNEEYMKKVQEIIKVNHIWNWHIFLYQKQYSSAQLSELQWLHDFYILTSNEAKVTAQIKTVNTTTQLALVDKFKFDKGIQKYLLDINKNIQKYPIDIVNLSQILILGSFSCDKYPTFEDFIEHGLNHFKIESIILTYTTGRNKTSPKNHQLINQAESLGKDILNLVRTLYEKDNTLYIDQYIEPKYEIQAYKLLEKLISDINTPILKLGEIIERIVTHPEQTNTLKKLIINHIQRKTNGDASYINRYFDKLATNENTVHIKQTLVDDFYEFEILEDKEIKAELENLRI